MDITEFLLDTLQFADVWVGWNHLKLNLTQPLIQDRGVDKWWCHAIGGWMVGLVVYVCERSCHFCIVQCFSFCMKLLCK